ncbi:MAG TPA: FG-GAP-like repeat-containing protein, partial [Planctomycetota bacterium]|nr:FG-GAP-like repeat-containing protein [Planctomycetota bacterium]
RFHADALGISRAWVPDSNALADVEGDGVMDLLIADRQAKEIEIWHCTESGTFELVDALAIPGASDEVLSHTALLASDIDGDGNVDVIYGDGVSGEIHVFRGTNCNPGALFRRGDLDLDGQLTVTDPVRVLHGLFGENGEAFACPDAADANDDGTIDLSDAVALLAFLFTDGPAPPPPGPASCGADPTHDSLSAGDRESCCASSSP